MAFLPQPTAISWQIYSCISVIREPKWSRSPVGVPVGRRGYTSYLKRGVHFLCIQGWSTFLTLNWTHFQWVHQGRTVSVSIFMTFMKMICRHSQDVEKVEFDGLRAEPGLFPDGVFCLNWTMIFNPYWSEVKCEATGMRINTSQSTLMVFTQHRLICTLGVGNTTS